MQDGLQALNTIVEESKSAGERVKKYCDDKGITGQTILRRGIKGESF